MAIVSKSELIKSLTESAQRMAHVREAAESERVGQNFSESEPRQINTQVVPGGTGLQKQT